MTSQFSHQQALWRTAICGNEVYPPGTLYWLNNETRESQQECVVQISMEGQIVLVDHADGSSQIVPSQSVLLMIHGEATSYGKIDQTRDHYNCEWASFMGAGLIEHFELIRSLSGPIIPHAASLILPTMRRLNWIANPHSRSTATELATACHNLLMMVYDLARTGHIQRQPAVDRAIEAILNQPLNPWSMKEIADRYDVSREHLSRIFTERRGESPAKYLNRMRTQHAINLLRNTSISVSEIAAQSGFTSTQTMARQVQRRTGQSPGRLRPSHKK